MYIIFERAIGTEGAWVMLSEAYDTKSAAQKRVDYEKEWQQGAKVFNPCEHKICEVREVK